jgi:hypothetical protein
VVKSTLALPTIAMRGRFSIVFLVIATTVQTTYYAFENRKAECSQPIRACQLAPSRVAVDGPAQFLPEQSHSSGIRTRS